MMFFHLHTAGCFYVRFPFLFSFIGCCNHEYEPFGKQQNKDDLTLIRVHTENIESYFYCSEPKRQELCISKHGVCSILTTSFLPSESTKTGFRVSQDFIITKNQNEH